MQGDENKKVAIIGGGFSGTALAWELLRTHGRLAITMFNIGNPLARGLAYGTNCMQHLLNVPAKNMSLSHASPGHLVDWLSRNTNLPKEEIGDSFIPRNLYGAYLESSLKDAIAEADHSIIFKAEEVEVISLRQKKTGGYQLTLASGNEEHADEVVLALGNFLPGIPNFLSQAAIHHPNFIANPYDLQGLKAIDRMADVCILGTGLTTIDVVLFLKEQNHQGKIAAISRNGYLPNIHTECEKPADLLSQLKDGKLGHIISVLRTNAREFRRAKKSALGLIDALRPQNRSIWLNFSLAEKREFVKKYSAAWSVSRHRMAPQIGDKLLSWLADESFKVLKGNISKIDTHGNDFSITILQREGEKNFAAHAVVNCTGPSGDYARAPLELPRQMLRDGLIVPDALNLGILASPDGQVLAAEGVPQPGLYTLGPPLKGILWETTAVPEIREQAAILAETIAQG